MGIDQALYSYIGICLLLGRGFSASARQAELGWWGKERVPTVSRLSPEPDGGPKHCIATGLSRTSFFPDGQRNGTNVDAVHQ